MSAVSLASLSLQRTAAVERLPFSLLLPLAVQHVFIMYAVRSPFPSSSVALNLAPEQVAFLISADLFAGGLATLVQSFGLPGIGIRLPVMMGVIFASVGLCWPWRRRPTSASSALMAATRDTVVTELNFFLRTSPLSA